MSFRTINIHYENRGRLSCFMSGCKKPLEQSSIKTLNSRLLKCHYKAETHQFKTCENSAIMSSLLNWKVGNKKLVANKGNIQTSHFNKAVGEHTVRWGNRELRKENIFWSSAIVQPEATESHFGTKTKTDKIDFNTHISNIWHEWFVSITKDFDISHTLSIWVGNFIE